jgi:hypothetical protein
MELKGEGRPELFCRGVKLQPLPEVLKSMKTSVAIFRRIANKKTMI